MKERPILMSAPMVRAILADLKLQTRRIAKLTANGHVKEPGGHRRWHPADPNASLACPYGQPGDRLWVREAFDFMPAGGPNEPQACEIVYWATGSHESRTAPTDYNPMIYGHEKVRPSIHMPRWASRITLEITEVRVERLQDISGGDALAEGYASDPTPNDFALPWYRRLWEQINGPGSWDANPWVWAVSFKRVEAS